MMNLFYTDIALMSAINLAPRTRIERNLGVLFNRIGLLIPILSMSQACLNICDFGL